MLIERQDDESLQPHNFCPDKYALLYSKIVIAFGDTQYYVNLLYITALAYSDKILVVLTGVVSCMWICLMWRFSLAFSRNPLLQ